MSDDVLERVDVDKHGEVAMEAVMEYLESLTGSRTVRYFVTCCFYAL